MQKALKVQRVVKTIRTEKQTLNGGRNTKLDVGAWIKFTRIGRITELTRKIGTDDVVVTVELKSISYDENPAQPVTETVYECSRCGEQFYGDDACFDHYDAAHKRTRKTKKGGAK